MNLHFKPKQENTCYALLDFDGYKARKQIPEIHFRKLARIVHMNASAHLPGQPA